MFKREKMLETIYESDENAVVEVDDSHRSAEQPSRLSFYICLCMIVGCFLAFGLLIAISLNPDLLTKKNDTKPLIQTTDSGSFTEILFEQLERLSQQINEQLDLPSDTIKILPMQMSANQSTVLWILSYLNYPRQCQSNNQCKLNFISKLKSSFTNLSMFLSMNQIHLNWCQLIDNSTRAILVSVISNRVTCDNVDPNTFISKVITHDMEFNRSIIDTTTYRRSSHSPSTQSIHCPNTLATQILLMENSS